MSAFAVRAGIAMVAEKAGTSVASPRETCSSETRERLVSALEDALSAQGMQLSWINPEMTDQDLRDLVAVTLATAKTEITPGFGAYRGGRFQRRLDSMVPRRK